MIPSLFLIASLTKAHAGFFDRLCEKLVKDDPYQFEQMRQDYLERERERLGIRIRWRKATSFERATYTLIGEELERRVRYK